MKRLKCRLLIVLSLVVLACTASKCGCYVEPESTYMVSIVNKSDRAIDSVYIGHSMDLASAPYSWDRYDLSKYDIIGIAPDRYHTLQLRHKGDIVADTILCLPPIAESHITIKLNLVLQPDLTLDIETGKNLP